MDIEYYYSNNQSDSHEGDLQVLKKLPQELNNKLQMEYSQQIISKIDFIIQNFSQQLQDELGYIMQEESYFPNQTIYLQDDFSNPSLIFILSGEVGLYQKMAGDQNALKIYKTVKKGEVFGQLSFITNQPRESTAKTTKYTRIIKIQRQDFISLLTQQIKDYETFCQLKDNIQFYDNYKDIHLFCSICESYTHQENNCTFTHISREQCFFKSSIEQRVKQVRAKYARIQMKQNSLINQSKVKELITGFLEVQELDSLGSQHFNQSDDQSRVDEQEEQIEKQASIIAQETILQRKKSMLVESPSQRRPSLLKVVQFPSNNQLGVEQSNVNINSMITPEKQNSGFVLRQSSFYEKQLSDNIKLEQEKRNSIISTHQLIEPIVQQNKGMNPWLFEQLKEYQYYFPKGNSRYFFFKANKFIRKRLNLIIKRKKNK